MQENSDTLIVAAVDGTTHRFAPSCESIAVHDNVLLYLSLAFLLFSTIDRGLFGTLIKLCWLVSFAALTRVNIGASFSVYIGSLAIYSPLHQETLGSLNRPDNYAGVILIATLLILACRTRNGAWHKVPLFACVSLGFVCLHGVLFSASAFPAIFRDIVVPLVLCALLTVIGFREQEFDALLHGMALLGCYLGIVSILDVLHDAAWILPPWIADPSLRPFDELFADPLSPGTSGGTFMEPAFYGLLLSLITVILLFNAGRSSSLLSKVAILFCAVGTFLTYERGPWLGLLLALLWFPGWCCSRRQAFARRVVLILLAVVILLAAHGIVGARLHDSETVFYRFAIWGAGLRLFITHPLFGIGFFNFAAVMSGVQQGFGSLLPSFREVAGDASHNTVITLLVEFGAVGLFLCATTFVKLVKSARRNAFQHWDLLGANWVLALVVVYVVNAQFVSAFEGTTNTLLLSMLGVIAGLRKEGHDLP